jgi:metal-responsive CopG/Arc/MetJ family transcriptional regulator
MNQTVNISFDKAFLKEIDKIAKKEHRSRSELIREAARAYIDRKSRWNNIFQLGIESSSINKISENDIFEEVNKVRKNKIYPNA